MMPRLLIQCLNTFLLIVILIGIPAITSARFGNLLLSSAPQARRLTLWALAVAGGGHGVLALGLVKGRKERLLCWKWAATFLVFLSIEYSLVHGYFNFEIIPNHYGAIISISMREKRTEIELPPRARWRGDERTVSP